MLTNFFPQTPFYKNYKYHNKNTYFNPYNNFKHNNYNNTTTIKASLDINNDKYDKATCSLEKNDDFLFEILGLKIYFDDLLIICILFFLYQENIKDEYLYIALILLLLS